MPHSIVDVSMSGWLEWVKWVHARFRPHGTRTVSVHVQFEHYDTGVCLHGMRDSVWHPHGDRARWRICNDAVCEVTEVGGTEYRCPQRWYAVSDNVNAQVLNLVALYHFRDKSRPVKQLGHGHMLLCFSETVSIAAFNQPNRPR